jgi:Ca2+-binding RTX toxin-like protein
MLTGSGAITDPNGNATLILGSAAADTVTARNRDDCVVGGAGNDTINGGAGTDVCIGGPGTDTFTACETTVP